MKRFTAMIMSLCLVALYGNLQEKADAAEARTDAKIQIVRSPLPTTKASASNFTGDVNVAMLSLLRGHLNLSSG